MLRTIGWHLAFWQPAGIIINSPKAGLHSRAARIVSMIRIVLLLRCWSGLNLKRQAKTTT